MSNLLGIVTWFFLVFSFAFYAQADTINIHEEISTGTDSPDTTCNVLPLPQWNQTEEWAWQRICEGHWADLSEHLGAQPFKPIDEDSEIDWKTARLLTPNFLETILMVEPFRNAVSRKGVRVYGAYFAEKLDLQDASLKKPLRLEGSHFESEVNMVRLTAPTYISLKNSVFSDSLTLCSSVITGELNMSEVRVAKRLNLCGISIGSVLTLTQSDLADVNLLTARIGQQVVMDDTEVGERLNMNSVTVGGSVFMRNSKFRDVDLRSSKISGQLIMDDSKFQNELNLGDTSASFLSMSRAKFKDANMLGAKIDKQINMNGATFDGELKMTYASVNGDIYFDNAKVNGAMSMPWALVRGAVHMSEGTFKSVSLEFAQIGELFVSDCTISEAFGMQFVSISGSFSGTRCKFLSVGLSRAEIAGFVNLEDAEIAGALAMDGIKLGANVNLSRGRFDEVILDQAKIDGDLIGFDTTINSNLSIEGASIDGNVILQDGKINQIKWASGNVGYDLYLNDATISGNSGGSLLRVGHDVEISNSVITGELNLSSATVGHSIWGSKTRFDFVVMNLAKIRNQIVLQGAVFEKGLSMFASSVGESMFLRGARFHGPVELDFVHIGGNLDIRGATIGTLDLIGSRIEQEFRIGDFPVNRCREQELFPQGCKLVWLGTKANMPKVNLRNAKVGIVNDGIDSWPDALDLKGFRYSGFGGVDRNNQHSIYDRGSEWFLQWLEKDEEYSPEPYEFLAKTLRTKGHGAIANDILFGKRDRELAGTNPKEIKWWGLWTLKMLIGYGYGWRNFFALGWAGLLVLVGAVVLHVTKERRRHEVISNWGGILCFSLDMLLPGIRLRERHYNEVDLDTSAKYYFYFHKLMGYILVFFVITGLSGLSE